MTDLDPNTPGDSTTAPPEGIAAVATTVPAARSAGDYFTLYVQRVRGGEMGSLPAIAGLVGLVILFSSIQPTFRGLYNFGNMLTEGSGPILLAMGLVFVLLLGEIDLSAGFAGGVCAAVMVRLMVGYDLPWPVTIGANQAIQFPLAQIKAKAELGRLMTYKAAWLFDHGLPCGNEANIAKLTGAQVAWEAADQAFQTLGGMAYSKEYPVERMFRDARIGKNIPVAEELVLAHIGTQVLGLPKSY